MSVPSSCPGISMISELSDRVAAEKRTSWPSLTQMSSVP